MNKIKIPSFELPKNNKNYSWERVKLNIDGENIPLYALHEIVKTNCPYLEVVEDSFFLRRIIDDFGDHVYVYYAIKRSAFEKKLDTLRKKGKKKP